MGHQASASGLDSVEHALQRKLKETEGRKFNYSVPSLWVSEQENPKRMDVNPFAFYLDIIKNIKRETLHRAPEGAPSGGEWTKEAVIYNMFVRTTTAFDHNGNNSLDLGVNGDGFRETGTFLKGIAMLPYIKRLGANTVHLLPITSIGHDGNKGTLGSPYAIRNPYELDENLSEPCLGLDGKTEFKAFVEAAHRIGLRVVVEFVFRTASKDADWVKDHPEWFYWIREEINMRAPHHLEESKYGSPIFSKEELEHIHHQVSEHRFDNLLPPHQIYRDFFTAPPKPDAITQENGRYVGVTSDTVRVKIPGAFADWPPDDNQPPWGDVTYLRMYDHPEFNYIAYSTIRMYDARLAQPPHINRPLWDKIVGIIPYYQHEYRIDGVMIDMGHALPKELKSEMVCAARTVDPDFAFWDENFSITPRSREEGYNAVFGYLWIDEHHPSRMRAFLKRCVHDGLPIPFFATPENHNTPRAASRHGGALYAKWAWAVNNFLPAVPFLHSGFELAETYPINTGLDFTHEQLRRFPSEKLPLFSEYAYDWLNKEQSTHWISTISKIREQYRSVVVNPDPLSFVMLHESNPHILAFARVSDSWDKRVAVVSNMNFTTNEHTAVRLDTSKSHVLDLISDKKISAGDKHITVTLHPGQCLIFEY